MRYEEPLVDFARRTFANIRVLESHSGTRVDEPPFLITARLGALITIVVLIREQVDALQRDHSNAFTGLVVSMKEFVTQGGGRSDKEQILAFRNALAHGDLQVRSDQERHILSFVFPNGRWEAVVPAKELPKVLNALGEFIAAI